MNQIRLRENRLEAGARFSFRLERTLRVPTDGSTYPLPPSFGAFPIYRMSDYASRVPREWVDRAAYLVPMYQWEAMWLSFQAADWKPNAVQVASGGVNAITGEPYPSRLKKHPQNYLVCPLQPWLDGFQTGEGAVSQFVAAPFGKGLTVEEQITGGTTGGLIVRIFESKPGIFPDRPPKQVRGASRMYALESFQSSALGLAAGGTIEQKVYPDPYGVRTWDGSSSTQISIALVNSEDFISISGEAPPPSPISAQDYNRLGFPWFKLYDDELATVKASSVLKKVKTLELGDKPMKPKKLRHIKRQ
jgi:hypothetical protein